MKKFCPTRWVESQECTQLFKAMYGAIKKALTDLSVGVHGSVTAGKALNLLRAVTNHSFLVSLEVLCLVLNVTRPVSVQLQAVGNDIVAAVENVSTCRNVINNLRDDDSFQDVFQRLKEQLESDIEMPRVASRQTKRSNPPAQTAYEYYRRAVFLPYLDTVIDQLMNASRNIK